MVQQSIVGAKGRMVNRIIGGAGGRIGQYLERRSGPATQRVSDWLAHEDFVTLADGQTLIVPRANLAAAKGLLAAQRAAERRVAAQRAASDAMAGASAFGQANAEANDLVGPAPTVR